MSLHNLIYNTYEVLNVKNALEETFKSKQSFFGKNRLQKGIKEHNYMD